MSAAPSSAAWHSKFGIPIRNLWMLLAYAFELAQFSDRFDADIDDSPDLAELLARLLTFVVEKRMRRNLSLTYKPQVRTLDRVRGRIDWLKTESALELRRGRVTCRFEELTHNTIRNRLVRHALQVIRRKLANDELAKRCERIDRTLAQAGVADSPPSRSEISQDRVSRHEADDRLMITVAKLILDMALPGEASGSHRLVGLKHDEDLLRRIFEKAIAGFYRSELGRQGGWLVRSQVNLAWLTELPTPGLLGMLPGMKPDLILDQGKCRRIVLDTKFSDIIIPRQYGAGGFKSAHLYQLYAYLRSQVGRGDVLADTAEGILLHPSTGVHLDESVTIQGHRIRFVTVDLTANSADIRRDLLEMVRVPVE